MKWLQTIRGKILLVFSLCFAFIALIAAFYYWHISSHSKELRILEDFEGLRNDILEVRRYEKNYILYRDTEDFRYLYDHLFAAERHLNRLAPEIRRVAGVTKSSELKESLRNYKTLIDGIDPSLGEQMTWAKEEAIGATGENVLELAHEILAQERKRLDRFLKRAMRVPLELPMNSTILSIISILQQRPLFRS